MLLLQFLLLGSQWGDEMKPPYPMFKTEAYWGLRQTLLLSPHNLCGRRLMPLHEHTTLWRFMVPFVQSTDHLLINVTALRTSFRWIGCAGRWITSNFGHKGISTTHVSLSPCRAAGSRAKSLHLLLQ